MITAVTQRWNGGRDTYRPAGEPIDTRCYEVAAIPDDRTAKAFVKAHHYSGSYVAARFRFGIYRRGLVGVAVFSVPFQPRSLDCVPGDAHSRVELGRFILADDVPANGETWFLGRCFDLLRREAITGVVSFSDPLARRTVEGRVVFGGHIGTIYQAHNANYRGRSKPKTLRFLPNGTLYAPRALSKIRRGETGWRYASGPLVELGAEPLLRPEDGASWLDVWLPRLTREIRHPGNHKYCWALHRNGRRGLPPSLPYPKLLPSPPC